MEQLLFSYAEKTIVGASFLYLLYYQVKNMDAICQNLNEFGKALSKVTETMLKIDLRVEMLEKSIEEFKRK